MLVGELLPYLREGLLVGQSVREGFILRESWGPRVCPIKWRQRLSFGSFRREFSNPPSRAPFFFCVATASETSKYAGKAEEAFNLALDYFCSADDVYHQVCCVVLPCVALCLLWFYWGD